MNELYVFIEVEGRGHDDPFYPYYKCTVNAKEICDTFPVLAVKEKECTVYHFDRKFCASSVPVYSILCNSNIMSDPMITLM